LLPLEPVHRVWQLTQGRDGLLLRCGFGDWGHREDRVVGILQRLTGSYPERTVCCVAQNGRNAHELPCPLRWLNWALIILVFFRRINRRIF